MRACVRVREKSLMDLKERDRERVKFFNQLKKKRTNRSPPLRPFKNYARMAKVF